MFELLWLLFTAILAWLRPRHDLVLEDLLIRHQLAVLTRPTRTRPRARLHTWDKLLWIVARSWYATGSMFVEGTDIAPSSRPSPTHR